MKKLLKPLYFTNLVVVFAVCHTIFMRLGLPAYSSKIAAYVDDLSYAMIIASILMLILNLPSLLRKLLLVVFVITIQLLVFSEWWHYEFYRDYIRYASLGHAGDIKEIARGIEGFQGRYLALLGSIGFFIYIFFLDRATLLLGKSVIYRLLIICLIFIGALIPTAIFTQHYQWTQIENWHQSAAIPLSYQNPVMQLFREKLIDQQQIANITPLHLSKVSQLYNTTKSRYPFYKNGGSDNKTAKKNVIFITLESVRKYETVPKDGISLTPNLNRIAEKNFTPKYYYANSNQTIKAEIALFCGMHDFLIGTSISAANNQQVKTNCLPRQLRDYGYRSYWFHGANSKFFNRNKFLPKIGFDELHGRLEVESKYIDQGKKYSVRHWGVEDPYVFDYALEHLEKSNTPFFAEILTVSNHHPFVDLDSAFKKEDFHPELPVELDDIYNRYQHLIYYTDAALGKFWKKFQKSPLYNNTVVVITGDHGIWLFPDEIEENSEVQDVVKYETYLRLPLTIYFPHKEFSEEANIVLSQVDVAEIVTTYLGIDSKRAFQSKLNNGVISKLLEGKQVADYFSNPVFSSIGDNFYFRNSNVACYPPLQSKANCDDFLFRCIKQHNTLQKDKHCVLLNGDALKVKQNKDNKLIEDYNTDTANIVVDYFRKSINFGLIPEESVLRYP